MGLFTDVRDTSHLPQDIKRFLESKKIDVYYKDELTNFFDDNPSVVRHYVRQTRRQRAKLIKMNSSQLQQLKKSLLNQCNPQITNVKKDLCGIVRTGTNIDPGYYNNVIDKVFNDFYGNTDYDIVILVDTSTKGKLFNRIVGFLISQVGECQLPEYIHIPVLNLICVNGKNRDAAKTLMFLYLYSLKRAGYKTGLLELAGEYCNIKGLCLYNKFGFREDQSLFSDSPACLNSGDTLPMFADIARISEQDLINVLIQNKPIHYEASEDHDFEPLCTNKYKTKPGFNVEDKEKLANMQQRAALNRLQNLDKLRRFNSRWSKKKIKSRANDAKKRTHELTMHGPRARTRTRTRTGTGTGTRSRSRNRRRSARNPKI